MILLGKFRSWLREPTKSLADDKLDWLGIILTVCAAATLAVSVVCFMIEMDYASGYFFNPHITQAGLLIKYPQKIFLLTPLAAFYAITRRKYCRTNAGCLKCYAVICGLFLISVLAIYWEVLDCSAEWGDMYWYWGGAG